MQKWAAEGPMCDVTTNEVAMLDMMLAKPFHHICKLQVLLRVINHKSNLGWEWQ